MGDYEKAIIAQGSPFILASQAREIVAAELIKGCDPTIWPDPVALEPIYSPIIMSSLKSPPKQNDTLITYENKPAAEDIIRLKVWISPDQPLKWHRAELFLKQLSSVKNRIGLEIIGNSSSVCIDLLCRRDDIDVVEAAFIRSHFITSKNSVFYTENALYGRL